MFATAVRRGTGFVCGSCLSRAASSFPEPFRIPLPVRVGSQRFKTSCSVGLEFPTIPEDVLREIDQTKPLANTVNLYSKHFSVSSGQYNWPSTTKEDIQYGPESINKLGTSPPFKLSQFLVDWATALKPNKNVMYTKSSHDSSLPCIHVYPDNLKIEFTSPSPSLVQIQQFQSDSMSFTSPKTLDFITVTPLPSNTVHIYICTHEQRDYRCGVIGPTLIQTMREYMTKVTDPEMQELDIQVFGCSHVGGHKYAGNVVIYRPQWKQGVWYGRVQPKDVPQIFEETVLGGRVIGRFWRGGLPDGRWDPKEHITAEEAERRAGETAENSDVMECACAK